MNKICIMGFAVLTLAACNVDIDTTTTNGSETTTSTSTTTSITSTTSTTSSTSTTTTTISTLPDNYVFAGYGFNTSYNAYIWYDGNRDSLTNYYGKTAATEGFRFGSDLYAVGKADIASGEWNACYWKNGEFVKLATNANLGYFSAAIDMDVNGADMYFGGKCITNASGYELPCVWHNGVQTVLPAIVNNMQSCVYGVAIDGSDYYAAGIIQNYSWDYYAALWKNGVKTILPNAAGYGWATDVEVEDGSVYVCGIDDNGRVCYWIDGAETVLTNPYSNSSYAYELTVNGGNIVIAGYYYNFSSKCQAYYWESGAFHALTNVLGSSYNSYANFVQINSNDMYVGGYYNDGSRNIPCYWRNGLFHILSNMPAENTYIMK